MRPGAFQERAYAVTDALDQVPRYTDNSGRRTSLLVFYREKDPDARITRHYRRNPFLPRSASPSVSLSGERSSRGGLTLSWGPAERCDDPAEGGGHPVQSDHVQPRSRRLPRTAPDGSMSGTSPLRSGSKCRLRRCTPPRCDGAGRRASNGQNPGLASTYRALPEHEKRQAYPEAAETAQAAFADGPSRSSRCPFCTHLGWTPWMPVRVSKLRGLQLGPEGSSPRWPR